MDTKVEIFKLNKAIEDYITPHGKHKLLIEATVLIDVDRDYLEELIRDENMSFKNLKTAMENELVDMKRPDWLKEVYIVDIKEENYE